MTPSQQQAIDAIRERHAKASEVRKAWCLTRYRHYDPKCNNASWLSVAMVDTLLGIVDALVRERDEATQHRDRYNEAAESELTRRMAEATAERDAQKQLASQAEMSMASAIGDKDDCETLNYELSEEVARLAAELSTANARADKAAEVERERWVKRLRERADDWLTGTVDDRLNNYSNRDLYAEVDDIATEIAGTPRYSDEELKKMADDYIAEVEAKYAADAIEQTKAD